MSPEDLAKVIFSIPSISVNGCSCTFVGGTFRVTFTEQNGNVLFPRASVAISPDNLATFLKEIGEFYYKMMSGEEDRRKKEGEGKEIEVMN